MLRSALLAVAVLVISRDAGAVPVIPPGREALVLELLHDAAETGCVGGDIAIMPTVIRAEYRCAGSADPLVVELRHPSAARSGDVETAVFAVGAPPGPLAEAVLASVRAHEAEWSWQPRGDVVSEPGTLVIGRPHRLPITALVVAAPILAIGLRRLAERAQR